MSDKQLSKMARKAEASNKRCGAPVNRRSFAVGTYHEPGVRVQNFNARGVQAPGTGKPRGE